MPHSETEIKKALEDIKEMKNILERGLPRLRKIFLTPAFGWLCISQAVFFILIMTIYGLFKGVKNIGIIITILIVIDCIAAGKWKLDIFRHGAKNEEYDGSILSFFKLPFIKELLNVGYILVGNTIIISLLVALRMSSLWLLYPLLFSGIGVTFLSYGAMLKSYSYKLAGIAGMLISFISVMLYDGRMELWVAGGSAILLLTCGLAILKEGKS